MKALTIAGKIIAVLIAILGIIHVGATFSPMIGGGLGCLDAGMYDAMIYMSLMCGTLLILCGLLLFLMLGKMQEIPYMKKLSLIVSIFSNINGVLSVIYMYDNPFAWAVFVLGLAMFVVVLLLRNKNLKQNN
ncbi:hypothetical protein [Dysgonomonas sp. 25]|uniref:hypothetical protein n=1 Tax=Dysgonomonas sp. 25 TaxID=2302933 RepID=UPI0013D7C490|nr:hypothetical protein [Dysgonomonas sp. 25]NDV68712.1 hypothetical protein [Dysgonomonas sp. 25]